jgi:tetratricopeptide (TPR) repeat protein
MNGVEGRRPLLQAARTESVETLAATAAGLRVRRRFAEAEALAERGTKRFPGSLLIWRERALAAHGMQHYDTAYECWAEIRRRFPRSSAGFRGALNMSQALRHLDMTDRLLAEGLASFPQDVQMLTQAAQTAARAGRLLEASRHWRALADLSPDDPAPQLAAATCLVGPKAGLDDRIPEVLRLLATLRARFPDYVPAYAAELDALRAAGRLDEAAERGRLWAERFPAEPVLAASRAQLESARDRPDAAYACIEAARANGARSGQMDALAVMYLALADKVSEAEALAERALAQYPDDADLLNEYVQLAIRRGDWGNAVLRARDAQRRQPDDQRISNALLRARTQVVDEADIEETPSTDEGSFIAGFESLGATQGGCEFGLVQRRLGAEPISLLRFAVINYEGLMVALLTDFDGVGSDESTELAVHGNSPEKQEYYVLDRRIGYRMHTFVKVKDAAQDRMLTQARRRMRFLRNKLIEDLRAGTKIFVYKFTGPLREIQAQALHAALSRYGDCTLLCVALANAGHPPGQLQMPRPGLFIGRVSSFMDAATGGGASIDMRQWLVFCRKVAAWHAQRQSGPAGREAPEAVQGVEDITAGWARPRLAAATQPIQSSPIHQLG